MIAHKAVSMARREGSAMQTAPMEVSNIDLGGFNFGVRSVPLLVGGFLAVIANQFWFLASDTLPADHGFMDRAWPWLFLAGSAMSLALAALPRSRQLWAWSGGVVFLAMGARGLTMLLGDADRMENLTGTQVRIFGVVWLLAAFLAIVVWRWLLGPACEMLRRWHASQGWGSAS